MTHQLTFDELRRAGDLLCGEQHRRPDGRATRAADGSVTEENQSTN